MVTDYDADTIVIERNGSCQKSEEAYPNERKVLGYDSIVSIIGKITSLEPWEFGFPSIVKGYALEDIFSNYVMFYVLYRNYL